ncbi:hypothetical protein ACJJTC_014810 [Scirpophaga incertulas]
MECKKCAKSYDLMCINIPKEKFKTFTHTGPSSTAASKDDVSGNINITRGGKPGVKPKTTREDPMPNTELGTLIVELRQLRHEVTEVKKQNNEIKNQMSLISENLSHNLHEYSKKLQNAEEEIVALKSTLGQLQLKLAAQDQDHLKNDLEILGIAEQANENLHQIVITASRKVGVQLAETDIEDVMRVGSKISKQPKSSASTRVSRPIVLKLLRRRKAEELLRAAKSRRNLTSENLVDGHPAPIFFNERLTRENRQLFREARKRTKEYGFQYCWIKNGGILVRKADGKPAKRIYTNEELDEKVGPPKHLVNDEDRIP